MAETTSEESLNNPKDTQSENSLEEIIPTKEIEAINPNQEIENMEVHHHQTCITNQKNGKNILNLTT